jgi:hypothetical protein
MARKGGRRGGSAARSAAAKKGWETRRRNADGGGKGSKPSTPSKPRTPPKTTTARGRARTAETTARAAVNAGGGTRATRSLLTAQRARAYYKATGTGKKRSKTAMGGALAKRQPTEAPVATRRSAQTSAPKARPAAASAPSKPPKIADALRGTLRTLAQSDARFYRELEQIVGPIKVQKPASRPAISGGTSSGGSQRGSVTRALRSTLRDLAQSDAARLREIQDITKPSASGTIKGSSSSGKALPRSKRKRKR